MTDVLFITPNTHGDVREEPVGTLLLGTILRNWGITAEILQFYHFGQLKDFAAFQKSALEKILEKDPKIVSFYTRCDSYHVSLSIARQLKARRPDIWIVFAGPQADITAVDTIREIDWVDFICCGEGETTVYPLFSSLLRGQPDLSVAGLVYRKDGQVVANEKPELLPDLDALPDIDYSLLAYNKEHYSLATGLFPVDVGRGCPFGCTYCTTKTFWGRKYRLKSPQRIIRELENIHARFGTTSFCFEHDMFTMKRTQVIETCRLMKMLDFPVAWRCSARMDCLDRELIDIMVDAGLKVLFVGVETASPRMQKLINKNLKLDGTLEMLSYIREKGVRVTASFIYGFPEETEQDVSMTMDMIASIKKIPGIYTQAHLCTFLPGTELSVKYAAEMTPTESYSDIVGAEAIADCRDLIQAHPGIFNHLMEYQTPLRTKLRYFSIFVRMWELLRPIYLYLSQKYPEGHLLDMYDDFVKVNKPVLEQVMELDMLTQNDMVWRQDRMLTLFKDDENYDKMADFYRLKEAECSEEVLYGGSVTDVYCISPLDLKRLDKLEACERGVYLVTVTGTNGGRPSYEVYKRRKK